MKQLRQTLTDKLIKWANDKYQADIVIDSFLAFMDATDWSDVDQLCVLNQCKNYFVDGYIRERLNFYTQNFFILN